jgi:DMSO/TMAO reductase YedYZ molybdopterin-dependent catalytic subunit
MAGSGSDLVSSSKGARQMVTRGFTGRRHAPDIAKRLPPGQSLTEDFPVLSAGPTPHVNLEDWSFTLKIGPKPVARWNWAEFNSLPMTGQIRDIHCVTKWSKLDTGWQGILIDDVLAAAGLDGPPTPTRSPIPMTAIPPMCRLPILSAAKP